MSALPRVLITGGEGQLGFELTRALQGKADVHAFDRHALNLANPEAIRTRCREIQPALILNPGAYTSVDKAESEPELAMAINGDAPGVLGEEAKRLGVPIVHFSTDYVFDGTATVPYRETDIPNPQSAYGRTKLQGEIALAQTGAIHFILRTSWLYSSRRQNFFLTMRRLARERDELRVVGDQRGTPTWVRPLASHSLAAIRLSGARAEVALQPGTYHLTAGGETTWFGFASTILDSIPIAERRARQVVPIETREFPTPARRPAYSVLNCGKFKTAAGIAPEHWRTELGQCIDSMKSLPS